MENREKSGNSPAQQETRIALIGIIVEDPDAVEKMNGILHAYGSYIIGRMGLPYRQKNINIICVAVDAPQDVISAMAGKLGRVRGANIKTAYSNFTSTEPEIKTE